MACPFRCFLFALLISLTNGHGGEPERKTLMISLDGFRWDYVDRIRSLLGDQSNIWRLIRTGAYAPKGIKSSFTTMTFPNHYTLATGLYQESHGIVSNMVYDPVNDLTHNLAGDHDGSIYLGEPIWTTLKKQKEMHMHMHEHNDDNAVVACAMWVGCQFGGFDKDHFLSYNPNTSWSDRIDRAIEWLSHESMQLVFLYYHEPDETGHQFGPKSMEMNDKLKEIDGLIGELIEKLKEKKMFDDLNLIIVSDHGMMDMNADQTEPMFTEAKLPKDMFYARSQEPAIWLVEPLPGRYNDTIAYFKQFPNLQVIEKPKIPERWHYKNSVRIMPLVVLAKPGYGLSTVMKGIHGYDNEVQEMRPTFIGHGPAFVPNSTVPMDMGTVDVYLLLCTILDLRPAPNNGTASLFPAFVDPEYLDEVQNVLFRTSVVTIAVCISVTVFALLFFLCHRLRKSAHAKRMGKARLSDNNGYMYKPLPLESVGPLLTTSVDLDLEDSDEFDDPLPINRKP